MKSRPSKTVTTMELLYDYVLTKYIVKMQASFLRCFESGGKKSIVMHSLKDAKLVMDLSVGYEIVSDTKEGIKSFPSVFSEDNTVTYVIQFSKFINSVKQSLSVMEKGNMESDRCTYVYARNVETGELFYLWEVCKPSGKLILNNHKKVMQFIFR